MQDMPEIECTECMWQGNALMLLCHPEDIDKAVDESRFSVCPDCGAVDSYEDYED